MSPGAHEDQLELFDLTHQSSPQPRRDMLGRLSLHLRHDQLVLAGIAGLIASTVVFACGVERGKQLVRAERAVLAKQQPETAPSTSSVKSPGAVLPGTRPAVSETTSQPRETREPGPLTPKGKQPGKPAVAKSRYAVQVVTFSQPHLAKAEIGRLKANGESAFFVMREGRISVYVGPFPSKTNAAQKVTMLRSRYRDCFVRTL